MDLNKMTREDFEALPSRGWKQDIGMFDSIVIIPMEISWFDTLKYQLIQWLKSKFSWFDSYYMPQGLHDSGYRCMDFVACKKGKPICRLSGCSDVVHLNGIGGYGKPGNRVAPNDKVDRIDWNIDCLRESGFLHLWAGNAQLEAGSALSSFGLYANVQKREATDAD